MKTLKSLLVFATLLLVSLSGMAKGGEPTTLIMSDLIYGYYDGYVITDEFKDYGVVFSKEGYPGTDANYVCGAEFCNPYRIDFVPSKNPITKVSLVLQDRNDNAQYHTLTAYNNRNRVVSQASLYDGGLYADPFTLTVKSFHGNIAYVISSTSPLGADVLTKIVFGHK